MQQTSKIGERFLSETIQIVVYYKDGDSGQQSFLTMSMSDVSPT